MSHLTIHTQGGVLRADLPDPQLIPAPRVRTAWERLRATHDKVLAATRARDAADEAQRLAAEAEELEVADAYGKGDEPVEVGAYVAEARDVLERAQIVLNGLIRAEANAWHDLAAAVDAEAVVWRSAALSAAAEVPLKVVAALTLLREAEVEHNAHVGTLGMLAAREQGSPILAPLHGVEGPKVDIGLAIEHAQSALARSSAELEFHRGAQKVAIKVAKKTAKKVEEVVITATSEGDDRDDD